MNKSAQVNISDYKEENDKNWPWTNIIFCTLFVILIVTVIVGNTLVILSVLTTRRLRTVTNCFVMSLAVADWLVGVFVMPPAVFVFLVGKWPLSGFICKIWISLDVLLCTASILSLCAISIDRYLAIQWPLNYSRRRRSKRLAMLMILIVWVLAIAITCPPFLGWSHLDQDERTEDCGYNQNMGYVIYSALGSFFLPMCIMLYVYSRIFCVLTSRQSRISRTEACERAIDIENEFVTSEIDSSYPQCSKDSVLNNTFNEPPQTTLYELLEYAKSRSIMRAHSNNSNHGYTLRSMNSVQFNQQQLQSASENSSVKTTKKVPIRISSLKRESKTAQTLSIVMFTFIACWLPFFIHYIAKPFLAQKSMWRNESLEVFLTWLGWSNSSFNFFIYAFWNNDFRIAFYRLTFRNCFRNQQNNTLK
ncbi:hypothetical protein PVAND_003635 [Polypedilum vanderplanki]|uniref:G-protein coupled receptors family 1 profile domain-containing protein n=1 Tax=Polypedilum vanderplanki TaxID=319348 RepID=A0A9J6BVP1_POLVA|nr:hypothetical protein PVAND_003635 [Polypedilum vanderplanki]